MADKLRTRYQLRHGNHAIKVTNPADLNLLLDTYEVKLENIQMMSQTMKLMIEDAQFEDDFGKTFDKAFNSGYFWAVESYDNISVTMVKRYYEASLVIFSWDDEDDYSRIELTSETDARMLKFFVPKKLLCESGDDSDIYAIGFMRGVVAWSRAEGPSR
jgi:hypothetical protein